jgi:hypothetical protein
MGGNFTEDNEGNEEARVIFGSKALAFEIWSRDEREALR